VVPARTNTTRFLIGFVAVLVALPTLVWGIQTISQDRSEPASPGRAAIDEPRQDELGCEVLVAPESLSERAAACETEPPSSREPQREPPREPRRGEMGGAALAETEDCAGGCSMGTIESETAADTTERVETTDQSKEATDVVGTLLAPTRELPTDRLDDVEERLGRIKVPEDATDPVTTLVEDTQDLVPDRVETRPEIEIQLDPVPTEPNPVPDPAPAVDPPTELAPGLSDEEPNADAPDDEEPAAPEPSDLTALLVLDERTAKQLGMPSRMTITLSDAVQRALAILSERAGLELSVAPAGSSEPSRD
jgi:hypothetical protein